MGYKSFKNSDWFQLSQTCEHFRHTFLFESTSTYGHFLTLDIYYLFIYSYNAIFFPYSLESIPDSPVIIVFRLSILWHAKLKSIRQRKICNPNKLSNYLSKGRELKLCDRWLFCKHIRSFISICFAK